MIRRMELYTRFSDEDRRLLDDLTSQRQRLYPAHTDVAREGDPSADIHIVLSGLACRYKILEGGTRQIMGFLVPGDPCDAEIFILKVMDHSIGTIVPSLIASISGTTMRDLLLNHPGIALAFWWSTLQDEGILRARIVDVGRRNAYSRIAFMICEMLIRMRAVGIIEGESFEFPVTQADIADATGLTPVYVNRVLHRLRDAGLIAIESRRWTVLDLPGLKHAAGFDPSYLHLDRAEDSPESEPGRRLEGLI